jgi:excisionase family DNA binding protein
MSEDEEYLRIPGHVPTEEAAKLLGITVKRVYQHIKAGHLKARMVKRRYMISRQAIEDFKRNPPGRIRKQPPPWRVYSVGINILGTGIQVKLRSGQKQAFQEKLKHLLEEESHRLTGTTQRYIWEDEHSSDTVHIWLVWKDNEMPAEAVRDREFEAFQTEFTDVLDWKTVKTSNLKGLLYT